MMFLEPPKPPPRKRKPKPPEPLITAPLFFTDPEDQELFEERVESYIKDYAADSRYEKTLVYEYVKATFIYDWLEYSMEQLRAGAHRQSQIECAAFGGPGHRHPHLSMIPLYENPECLRLQRSIEAAFRRRNRIERLIRAASLPNYRRKAVLEANAAALAAAAKTKKPRAPMDIPESELPRA